MTHDQIVANYPDKVAKLFDIYGIAAPVTKHTLANAVVHYPDFADDLHAALGIADEYENLGGKLKAKVQQIKQNRQQKKIDRKNGIQPSRKAARQERRAVRKQGKASGTTPTAATIQQAQDVPEVSANIANEVQSVQDGNEPQARRSVGDTIEKIAGIAGAAANGITGVVQAVKSGGAGSDGEDGGIFNGGGSGGGSNDREDGFMAKLKKYWYVPVLGVVVLAIGFVALRRK